MTSDTENNALVSASWEDELARDAEAAQEMERHSGGGNFFKTRGGILAFDGMEIKNNQIAAIILDSLLENVYYAGDFDADNPTAPYCFAHARREEDLAPHAVVREHHQDQHEVCKGCDKNKWASADKGKGKACRNTRRIGIISAGSLDTYGKFLPHTDPQDYATAPVGMLKLPVTSVKGYANFVKQIAGAHKRPLYGVYTRIKVIPDAKTQFRITFELLGMIGAAYMPTVMTRRREVMATIDTPYNLDMEDRADETMKQVADKVVAEQAAGKTKKRS